MADRTALNEYACLKNRNGILAKTTVELDHAYALLDVVRVLNPVLNALTIQRVYVHPNSPSAHQWARQQADLLEEVKALYGQAMQLQCPLAENGASLEDMYQALEIAWDMVDACRDVSRRVSAEIGANLPG